MAIDKNIDLREDFKDLKKRFTRLHERYDLMQDKQIEFEKRLGFVEGVQRGKVSVHKFQALLDHLKIRIKKNCEVESN